MVYRGLVIEAFNDHIIVLTEGINYIKIRKKGNIDIGKKIMFIEEDIIRERRRSFSPFIGIAVAIILFIITITGQFSFDSMENFGAYAIVSLDINPSLEFQINRNEIVKKVRSLNEDGQELIARNMIGMKIEDAIILSIKRALSKHYLNRENDNIVLVSDVIINSNSYNPTVIEDKIFKKIEEEKELENIDIIYIDSDKEDLERARENQVSVGKYKVYEIVSNDNPDVKIEDLKDKNVSDIIKENKNLKKGESVKAKEEKKDKKNKKDSINKKSKNKKSNRKNSAKKKDNKKVREKKNNRKAREEKNNIKKKNNKREIKKRDLKEEKNKENIQNKSKEKRAKDRKIKNKQDLKKKNKSKKERVKKKKDTEKDNKNNNKNKKTNKAPKSIDKAQRNK